MAKSKIEWCDYSWNPVHGCTKVSEGCRFCFAEKMARRLAGRAGYPEAPKHFDVTLRPDRLDQPLRWKKPGRVFVCSMGDLFHEDVPFEFAERVFTTMVACNGLHTFQVLTKRPERMHQFYSSRQYLASEQYARNPYANVWLGVSVENQQAADERIPVLLQTPATVRFVSAEPMLGPVDFMYPESIWPDGPGRCCADIDGSCGCRGMPVDPPLIWGPGAGGGIHWAIVGCESGPSRRSTEIEWIVDLVKQCKIVNVPVFVKQIEVNGKVSRDPAEWPEVLRVQEYPE